jgi:glycine/D-amino acid oxidase-like deaminating enzyme
LTEPISADACVVGLGAAGLSCVDELLDLGADVVGIDAGHVGGAAAGSNGGFLMAGIAPFHHVAVSRYGRDAAVAMYRETMAELDRTFARHPDITSRTGSLRVAVDDEERADCREQYRVMREDDLPVEWYEGPEGDGLLMPKDGTFHPLRRCQIIATDVRRRGAQLFEQSAATRVAAGLVQVGNGAGIRARTVIVAVDGRLETVLPQLAASVRTARLQMIATAPVSARRFARPVYARHGYEYWQQLSDGRVVLGGFRDRGGDEEWTSENGPSETVQKALDAYLRDVLGIDAPITHRWAANVAFTATGLPFLGEVDGGVWAVGAYCGTGNIVGPLLGRAVARRALRGADAVYDLFARSA